jgi:5-methyltetrahydrofolate--homocysteine methyltransferase
MQATLAELLAAGGPLVADGGMGTQLQLFGLAPGAPPESWNLDAPDRVRDAHRAYLDAGAAIILTNTFGASPPRLALHGIEARCAEVNRAAARLAREAANAAPQPVVVAGSLGPTGLLLEPLGPLSCDDAADAFARQAAALLDGGVDALWIETMSDLREVQAAIEGARRAWAEAPLVATLSFDTHGRTLMGVAPQQAALVLSGLGLAALGGNCGVGPGELQAAIMAMKATAPAAVLVAKPNAGTPRWQAGRAVYDLTPEAFATAAGRLVAAGARIVGGCCGSGPAHIRAWARTAARGDD